MKKILKLIVALFLVTLLLPLTSCTASKVDLEEYMLNSDKTGYTYMGKNTYTNYPYASVYRDYAEYENEVTVPNEYNGLPVTAIGPHAFASSTIEKVKLSDTIKVIHLGAFSNCKDLKSIELPESLESIERAAFYFCSSLTSIKIPNSVKKIGDSAFWYCENLREVEMSNNLEELGEKAFYNCHSLKRIVLPKSLSKCEYPFEFCYHLYEVINYSDCTFAWQSCSPLNVEKDESMSLLTTTINDCTFAVFNDQCYLVALEKDSFDVLKLNFSVTIGGKTYDKIILNRYVFYNHHIELLNLKNVKKAEVSSLYGLNASTVEVYKDTETFSAYAFLKDYTDAAIAWGSQIFHIKFNGTKKDWEKYVDSSIIALNVSFEQELE